jgi:thiosulfate reductase / polysulfide reductase chain A
MSHPPVIAADGGCRSICGWCKGRCDVSVHSRDGRLSSVKIIQDAEAGARGRGCKGLRVKNAAEWFYHPDRLTHPLKRSAERGANCWTRISWDQALDEIAGRLGELKAAYGAETLAVVNGDSWTHEEYKQRFLSLFGTPNHTGPSPICMGPRALVSEAVMGWYPQFSVRPSTRCIVMLGCNAAPSRPELYRATMQALQNGAKLITLDPRRTELAERSDLWLQVRPGTDGAVLLAMIGHIIDHNLYDAHFVEHWCHGFAALKERVGEYPVERAALISGVPAADIRRAAEMYASCKPAAFVEGMGVEQQSNSAQILHARCILAGITGNIDVEGGEELPGPHMAYQTDRQVELVERLTPEMRQRQIGHDRFRLHSWPGQEMLHDGIAGKLGDKGGTHWYLGQANQPSVYRAILSGQPYPVKAMISSAGNPMTSHANTKLVYAALQALDLYVVADHFMNPTAQLADYVLPIASWLEKPQLWSYMGYRDKLSASQAALSTVSPEYDRRSDFDLWGGLGMRLGQEADWPWRTLEESYHDRLQGVGISFDELCRQVRFNDVEPTYRKYERQGFATPTGKFELHSTVFERLGYDPLPYYRDPVTSWDKVPGFEAEHPIVVINGGRPYEFMNSQWRQIDELRARYPDPLVQMHPATAEAHGIEDGDWVWLENPLGRIKQRCTFFSGILEGVAHADAYWWYPELPGAEPSLHGIWISNINVLMDDNPDICNEIIGTWPLRYTRCRIYRVEEGDFEAAPEKVGQGTTPGGIRNA